MSDATTSVSAAVMITRPPEIVACLKICTSTADVFVIFDSHVRPNHPLGAGFILNTSIDATAKYLATLFMMENRPLGAAEASQFQWQFDLMRHFSGHILISKAHDGDTMESATQTLLESSMAILALNAELTAMKSENMFLATELEKSQKACTDLETEIRARNQAYAIGGTSSSPIRRQKEPTDRRSRSIFYSCVMLCR